MRIKFNICNNLHVPTIRYTCMHQIPIIKHTVHASTCTCTKNLIILRENYNNVVSPDSLQDTGLL